MPIIRKIIKIGTSAAVVLPKSWLDFIESTTGTRPTVVLLEVSDKIVVMTKEMWETQQK